MCLSKQSHFLADLLSNRCIYSTNISIYNFLYSHKRPTPVHSALRPVPNLLYIIKRCSNTAEKNTGLNCFIAHTLEEYLKISLDADATFIMRIVFKPSFSKNLSALTVPVVFKSRDITVTVQSAVHSFCSDALHRFTKWQTNKSAIETGASKTV